MESFTLNEQLWLDATTYSRNDTERKPTSWETKIEDVRIFITCGHIHYRPEWIFHCRELYFDTKYLPNAKTKEDAARQAMKYCIDRANYLHSVFSAMAKKV